MLFKKGSSGEDVRKIQKALNDAGGYGLDEDGIYGSKTRDAVTRYQQSNGLGVDGIVGSETWGKLFGGGSGTQNNAVTAPQETAPTTQKTPLGTEYDPAKTTGNMADLGALEGKAPGFEESQAYQDAAASLKAHQSAKPGEYTSPYAQRIEQLYEQVVGRGDFEYDFNADPLYHMYKDQYMQGGKQAMQDAAAEAAALTGGYGNSYAATAGNLAYQDYLNGLNGVIPELHNQAYQEWLNGGDQLVQRLQLAQELDQDAYNRYRDQTGDWYTDLEYLTGAAQDAYNRDYGAYQDAMDKYLADRDYYYGKTQDDQAQQNYEDEQALAMAAAASSSGGGSSGGSGGGSKTSGSGGTSGDYKTVLNNAKNMSGQKAYDYVQRMVDQGVITEAEGSRILNVEVGMNTSEYAEKETGENNYSLNTLRQAIEQVAREGGMRAAEDEIERMVKEFGLTNAMRSMLYSDARAANAAY